MTLTRDYQPLRFGIHGRKVGDIYEFRIAEPPIKISISNLNESRGDIRAEIRVLYQVPDYEAEEIARDRITITGGQSKKSFAELLFKRPPISKAELPWIALLEVMCNTAIDCFREGEPVIRLANMPTPKDPGYLIRKLLARNQTTLLYGDGESCKSYTAMALGIITASQKSLPNLELEGTGGPVLYLDWETNWERQLIRAKHICQGHSIDLPETLYYRRMERKLVDDLQAVRNEAQRLQVQLIIYDSLGLASGGNSKEEDTSVQFFTAIREIGDFTHLVIHHLNWSEAQSDGIPRPYGSIYNRNQVRSAWAIRRAGEEGSPHADVIFFHTKSNDDVRFRPFALHFDFAPNTTTIRDLDPETIPAIAVHMDLAPRIRTLLGDGEPRTTDEIAHELITTPESVKMMLNKMPEAINLQTEKGRGKKGQWVLKVKEGTIEEKEIPF